ncbi:MAG TPA: hypothetical protein VK576_09205, partial [Thermoleophilia bacterium]|nr:hypothetical protein [Thermoleophilia bacterium]
YLSDVNIPTSAIAELADGAMTQQRLLVNNPRRLTRDDIIAIYENGAVRPGSKPVRATSNGKGKAAKAKAAVK